MWYLTYFLHQVRGSRSSKGSSGKKIYMFGEWSKAYNMFEFCVESSPRSLKPANMILHELQLPLATYLSSKQNRANNACFFLLMGPISEKVDKALAFLFGFCPQA